MSGLEYLRAIGEGRLPGAPIAQLMGFDGLEAEEGRVVFGALPGEYHYNPIGVVHGGLALTLLDSAMGCAVHSTLPPGAGYTTLEVKVNFARPITRDTGRIVCEGTVIHPRPHGRDRRGTGDRRGHGQAARPRHHHLPDRLAERPLGREFGVERAAQLFRQADRLLGGVVEAHEPAVPLGASRSPTCIPKFIRNAERRTSAIVQRTSTSSSNCTGER